MACVGARIGACRGQPRAADAAYWLCGGEGEGEEGVAVGEAGGALLRADAAAWERVDDVVMGGVSSSRVWADEARGALVWAGVCRAEGGGFAGARTRPFTAPLDLSAFDGLALRVVCEGDGEPERRTWKATVRTQRGRGEEVYQAAFVPPTIPDSDVFLPWESFKLVRGPRAAPNAPPLMAAACTEVYGLGFVLSRFKEPAPGQPPSAMEDFREGPFRLALWAMGVYLRDRTREADARGAVASAPRPPPLPPPEAPPRLSEVVGGDETANTGRARRGPLAPILAFVFSEAARRRKRARVLLQRRYGIGQGQSRLLGQRLKRARGLSPSGAAAEGLLQLARDGVAFVAALPIKLLFRALRLVAMLKRRFAGGKQRVAA